jgi:uncharacterized repeat protein (TIGR01451 family)
MIPIRRLLLFLSLLLGLAFVFGPIMATAQSESGSQDVQLLKSSTESVVLELVAPELSMSEKATADGSCMALQAGDFVLAGEPGSPQVPVKSLLVGVPPEAEVTARVVEHKEYTVPGEYSLCPVPTPLVDTPLPGAEGIPLPEYVGEEAIRNPATYAADAFYPDSWAEIADDGFLRQQRFVRLQLSPFQYNPATRQLRVQQRLLVELQFTYPQGTPSASWTDQAEPFGFEEILRQSLLNYETARHWRLPRLGNDTVTIDAGSPSPGYRVSVDRNGIYELSYDDLMLAGVPPDVNPKTFQMFSQGHEIAIYVEGEGDDQLDPADYILFFGQGIDSKFTELNVYWLTYGSENGRRMPGRNGMPSGGAPLSLSSLASVHLEKDNPYSYWPKMPGPDDLDRWYWDYRAAPSTLEYTAVLSHPVTSGYTATLTVQLYGYTASPVYPDHHVIFKVNDTWVGEAQWDGLYSSYSGQFGFPSSLLVPGVNTITVESPGDTGAAAEANITDWFEIEYRGSHTADGDSLRFSGDVTGTWEYQVSGFGSDQIELFDITEPISVSRIITKVVEYDGVSYTLRFEDSHLDRTDYLAEVPTGRLSPLAIELDSPSDLHSAANGADYILVTHAAFYTDALPLADYYTQRGMRTLVVDVQDVYDEFSYGVYDPHAIQAFLAYAYDHWMAPAPSYVLLVGDGHYDFKNNNNLGAGRKLIYVPPYLALADPWMGETAADNRYVCVSGQDTVPDMHLGRFPVNSTAEMTVMRQKSLDYQQNPPAGAWNSRLVFSADNVPDAAGNFVALSNSLIDSYVAAPYVSDTVYINDYCGAPANPPQSCPTAAAALRQAINEGRLLVNYIGHASISAWAAEAVFSTSQIPLLTNSAKWPIMLPMACLDGYYINPITASGTDGLGESIVRVGGKGAIASWSPTGLGVVQGHHFLDEGFFQALFFDGVRNLGAVTTAGKLYLVNHGGGSHLDLLDTYTLFGDPALRINALGADLHLQKTVEPTGPVVAGDVLTYTLTFSNTGPATAFDVVLSDTVPYQLISPTVVYSSPEVLGQVPGVTYAWTITDMVSGTVGTVQFRAVVAPASVPSVIVNQADLTSGVLREVATTSNNLYVANADLRVEKAVEPPGQVDPGDVLTYTLTFTNAGPDPAYGVVLTDILPSLLVTPTVFYTSPAVVAPQPGITYAWTLADLPPHTGGEIHFRAFVSPAAQVGSIVVNEASIAALTPDFFPSNNTISVTTGVRAPDMFAHKTGPASINFGQSITYTLSWGNQGEMAAPAVRLTDTLPAGVEYVGDSSGVTPGYDPGTGRVIWQMPGDVPAGTQATFVLTGAVTMDPNLAGPLVNMLRIQSGLPDTDPSDNTATWPTGLLWPDVGVQMAGPADLTVLTQISHTLTYSNAGDGLAQGVVLTEVLPTGLTYLSDDSGLPHAEPVTGTHVWQVGELSSGADGSFAVTLAVGDYAQVGTEAMAAVHIGSATPDADEANNTASWMAMVLQPDLAVYKTGPAQAGAHSTITYTLAYSNEGQGPSFGVVLTDVLPPGLTYLSDDSGLVVTTPLAGTYVWQAGDLAPGQRGTFHLVVEVGTLAETGPEVTNLLRIGSDSPDVVPANDESPWLTSIHQGNTYVYLPVVFKSVH